MATEREIGIAAAYPNQPERRGDDLGTRRDALLTISTRQRKYVARKDVRRRVRTVCRRNGHGVGPGGLPESVEFIAMLGVGGDPT